MAAIALEQHRGVFALDVAGPLDVFINAQYLVDAVRDAVAEGLFGQFAGRDRVKIGVEHTF